MKSYEFLLFIGRNPEHIALSLRIRAPNYKLNMETSLKS